MSPEVTIRMAKAEGWYSKNGSKWQTMPELMLHYRAATLFARTYCPEITLGMQTSEEVIDITPSVVSEAAPKKSRFEARKESEPSEAKDEPTATEPLQEPPKPEPVQGEAELEKIAKERGLTLDDIKAFCAAYKSPYKPQFIANHAENILTSVEMWKKGGAK